MGKVKNNEAKKYVLTEEEFNYLKTLAICLTYNIAKDKLISGFLYFIAQLRFGFDKDIDLAFKIDLDGTDRELSIELTD